jgi:hypothetical protein
VLPGEDDALRPTIFMEGSEGGLPGLYRGAPEVVNVGCVEFGTSFMTDGCALVEYDSVSFVGSTFRQNTFINYVNESAVQGAIGGTIGENWESIGGALGMSLIQSIGAQAGDNPLSATGGVSAIVPITTNTMFTLGYHTDYSMGVYAGPANCEPSDCIWNFNAAVVRAATRLTSDGNAASGWLANVYVTNNGSGYVTSPAVTVTGGCDAVVNTALNVGNSGIFYPGVYSPGTVCPAETTLTVAMPPTGVTALLTPRIMGNTMNMPINSTNTVSCTVNALDTAGDNIAWTIGPFAVLMGATSSTTTIPSAPTWTAVPGSTTTNAVVNLAIGVPTADTTLGALSIVATPANASFIGHISSGTMTVDSGLVGTIGIGAVVSFPSSPAGLHVVSGSGPYTLSVALNLSSQAISTSIVGTYGGKCEVISSAGML